MALELKQSLKLSQQLLITPQLQQAIKLLQLSRMELIETVQKELMENPVLEESDDSEGAETTEKPDTPESQEESPQRLSDLKTTQENEPADPRIEAAYENEANGISDSKEFDWSNYLEQSSATGRTTQSFAKSTDDRPNYENILSTPTNLHDYLEWQAKMGSLSEKEEECCLEIIGNLDDNGYLRTPLEELEEKSPYALEELEDCLCFIQDLDPPGVGARTLKECLLLQIRDIGPDKHLLTEMIENHLPFIEKRHYQALSKKMGLTPDRARELAEVIFSLEPKPGRSYNAGETQYITPDVTIKKIGNEYAVILNEDGMPKLQISDFYKTALLKELASGRALRAREKTNGLDKEAQAYIHEKLKSALWLIKSIHQRQKTLYKVTKAIASFQREFMEIGISRLKPLVLRDVAEKIGVHESTVSRATNGKYVHTPQGIFELKYFFNTGITNTTGGDDFANEAVKQMISKYISGEDSKNPLSDQALTSLLKQQGMDIARRTVAKYREMVGMLPSSKRKRLY